MFSAHVPVTTLSANQFTSHRKLSYELTILFIFHTHNLSVQEICIVYFFLSLIL